MRLFLTLTAAIASTCLVLWMASGYESLLRSYDVYAERALGRYTLSVDPISRMADRHVPMEIVTDLREDPAITVADPMAAQQVVVQSDSVVRQLPPPGSGTDPSEMPATAILHECLMLGTDASEAPFPVSSGKWVNDPEITVSNSTDGSPEFNAALSARIAKRFGVKVGKELKIGRGDHTQTLHVVGIVDNPPMPITGRSSGSVHLPTPSIGGIYVSMQDAETIWNRKPTIAFVGLCLKDGVDVHAFRYRWSPKLSSYSQPAQFQRDYDLEEQLDEAAAAENMKLQAYVATFLGMLLAFLVIFNTLNMSVSEQIRQFAMLRAICLTRAQVTMIIFFEGMTIACLGFIAGVIVGQGVLSFAGSLSKNVLHHGASVGPIGFILAAIATFGAAFLASLVPAWRATRIRPLDAMSPPQDATRRYTIRHCLLLLVGLGFIAIAPLVTFVFSPQTSRQAMIHLFIALGSLSFGFMILIPHIVYGTDRLLGPVVARCLGLSPKLLTQQLSCHLWRSVASAVALSVGLTLYISIQVWGYTMLQNFVPGNWAPDMIIAFGPSGLSQKEAEGVALLPGIDTERCVPIVVEQPRLREDLTGSANRATVTRQDNVVMIGMDPSKVLAGEFPLLDLNYLQGSREAALTRMKQGHACIVPEHFLRETGLNLGDQFEVVPPENPNPKQPAVYTIAASARLRGWHWLTKTTGLRVRTHRAAAMIIADYDSVATDFQLEKPSHVWLKYDSPNTSPDAIAKAAQGYYADLLGEPVLNGKPRKKLNEDSQEADFSVNESNHQGGQGTHTAGLPQTTISSDQNPPYIQAVSSEQIRHNILTMAKRWLWAVSVMPLIAVAIGCIGVLNVIISSVQARRWEFGILRAIGFGRGTLIRLVICEGLLVGLVTCVISLGFGIIAGWCGTGIARYVSFFGGMQPELAIPKFPLAIGVVVVLLFATLTAIGPAIKIGRTAPLSLLQQGRSIT